MSYINANHEPSGSDDLFLDDPLAPAPVSFEDEPTPPQPSPQDSIMSALGNISQMIGGLTTTVQGLAARVSNIEASQLAAPGVPVMGADAADRNFGGNFARSVDIVTRPVSDNPKAFPNANFGGVVRAENR